MVILLHPDQQQHQHKDPFNQHYQMIGHLYQAQTSTSGIFAMYTCVGIRLAHHVKGNKLVMWMSRAQETLIKRKSCHVACW